MELNLDTGEGHYQIRAYAKDFIQVNEQKIRHSLIIMPNQLVDPWPPHSIADLPRIIYKPLSIHQVLYYSVPGKT